MLRRQLTWFWHDLSHFTTAMGRGQLWWAAGQLEELRRTCINLARLKHDFSDSEVGDDPTWKVDKTVPAAQLAPLQASFAPLEPEAMLEAARTLIRFFRETGQSLAAAHGVPYPAALEEVMAARLEALAGAGSGHEGTGIAG